MLFHFHPESPPKKEIAQTAGVDKDWKSYECTTEVMCKPENLENVDGESEDAKKECIKQNNNVFARPICGELM